MQLEPRRLDFISTRGTLLRLLQHPLYQYAIASCTICPKKWPSQNSIRFTSRLIGAVFHRRLATAVEGMQPLLGCKLIWQSEDVAPMLPYFPSLHGKTMVLLTFEIAIRCRSVELRSEITKDSGNSADPGVYTATVEILAEILRLE